MQLPLARRASNPLPSCNLRSFVFNHLWSLDNTVCFPKPLQAREWIAFADLELSHGNNERVNEIFGRCLRGSPSVALWHFYLTYIRRTNPIDRSSIERAMPARDVITKAFEFSLAHVGADIEAGSIWHDYIEFLKEGEVSVCFERRPKLHADSDV